MAKVKKAINDALTDLGKEQLELFCSLLVARKEEPRIRRGQIEDKSRIHITDKIVSAYTEDNAIKIVVQILKEIGANDVAVELEQTLATAGQSGGTTASVLVPKDPAPSVPLSVVPKDPAPSVPLSESGIAFVKQHRTRLIERVTSIASILDILLENGAINHEAYVMVRSKPTNPEKMRELYEYLLSDKARHIFYEALTVHEVFVLEELQSGK